MSVLMKAEMNLLRHNAYLDDLPTILPEYLEFTGKKSLDSVLFACECQLMYMIGKLHLLTEDDVLFSEDLELTGKIKKKLPMSWVEFERAVGDGLLEAVLEDRFQEEVSVVVAALERILVEVFGYE